MMRRARPDWLRKQTRISTDVLKTRQAIDDIGLQTVCESARCPNLSECYSSGNATFLILGDHCTRNCRFCAVEHNSPKDPDPDEGLKIVRYMKRANIRFAVITSVTRDDLVDGGAAHFRRVVGDIKEVLPEMRLELLVPDFRGNRESINMIAGLPVEVFAHNVETVQGLYTEVRNGADYNRSLEVLRSASDLCLAETLVKSGIMVGLGEKAADLDRLFADLGACSVDILTIGQYLRPGRDNLPVHRYYTPEEFEVLKERALNRGIRTVVSGPYVRSSYLAEMNYLDCVSKNAV